MCRYKLNQATNNFNLDALSTPPFPFSEKNISNHLFSKANIDTKFLDMSKSFFETAYSRLLQLLSNDNCEESDVLIVLHNLFIGLELGLKSALSGFRQRNSDTWMFEISDIQSGHQLENLISQIKNEHNVSPGVSGDSWLDKRLDIISEFVSSSNAISLNFETTRYPIDRWGQPFDYLNSNMTSDLDKLKAWIELLYKTVEEISFIHDFLDGARSSYM